MSDTARPRYRPSVWIGASMVLHIAGVLALLAGPSRWPFVLGALFADHVSLLLAGLWPRSRLLGPNIRSLSEIGPHRTGIVEHEPLSPRVALTFDDGPDPVITPRVLDLLDQWQARASFFCIGQNAEQHPELVREIVARGHSVENHTWSHSVSFMMTPSSGLRREIGRSQELLTELTGRPPSYFRAPAGFRSPWLEPHLVEHRLRLVSWTARGFDGKEEDPGKVLARLDSLIGPEGIVVLHDGRPPADRESPRRHRLPVLEVLPELFSLLERRELSAIALPNPNKTGKSLTPSGQIF